MKTVILTLEILVENELTDNALIGAGVVRDLETIGHCVSEWVCRDKTSHIAQHLIQRDIKGQTEGIGQ